MEPIRGVFPSGSGARTRAEPGARAGRQDEARGAAPALESAPAAAVKALAAEIRAVGRAAAEGAPGRTDLESRVLASRVLTALRGRTARLIESAAAAPAPPRGARAHESPRGA